MFVNKRTSHGLYLHSFMTHITHSCHNIVPHFCGEGDLMLMCVVFEYRSFPVTTNTPRKTQMPHQLFVCVSRIRCRLPTSQQTPELIHKRNNINMCSICGRSTQSQKPAKAEWDGTVMWSEMSDSRLHKCERFFFTANTICAYVVVGAYFTILQMFIIDNSSVIIFQLSCAPMLHVAVASG